MTILNFHIDEKEKKKIQDFATTHKFKSASEFVRQAINDKFLFEPENKVDNLELKIPPYIPQNKYVAFIRGAIVAVGDSPSEVSLAALEKFPDDPFSIKFNGIPKKKIPAYIFATLEMMKCWKYSDFDNESYPVVPIYIHLKKGKKLFGGIIDTAATICMAKQDMIPEGEFTIAREEEIYTAGGVVNKYVYSATISIESFSSEIDFITTVIPRELPFQFLIGRNLLDLLDAFFFGKKQLVCLRQARE